MNPTGKKITDERNKRLAREAVWLMDKSMSANIHDESCCVTYVINAINAAIRAERRRKP